jgi:D-aminopeptidase
MSLSTLEFVITLSAALAMQDKPERPRARDLGIVIGDYPTGKKNSITDVSGVRVGHTTIVRGENVRTGVTIVLPHGGNLFQEKVPASVYVGNAFGKLVGSTQVQELGNIESPIGLTNTLNVWKVADAIAEYVLEQPGNERVQSINVVVGETNDGRLNDIRGRHVGKDEVVQAIRMATDGLVAEGAVGAGTGTVCFGWKGGIGTSSREVVGHTVGVLVQTNFGGSLTIAGVPVHKSLQPPKRRASDDGSCMIVVATDAPIDSRNLHRLGQRAVAGMARTGSSYSNGSGDYAIAFSTSPQLRIHARATSVPATVLTNEDCTPLFRAVMDATEEAILNSLFKATAISSRMGEAVPIPVDEVQRIMNRPAPQDRKDDR